MKNSWKRLLALLLVLTMCVGLFPAAALAEEPEEDPAPTEEPVPTDPLPDNPGEPGEENPAEPNPTEPPVDPRDDTEPEDEMGELEPDPDTEIEATVASGTCGDNLTWTLDDTGTLTISGTGDMWDFESTSSPWATQRGNIDSVILEPGVTSIGDWAFQNCYNMTEVVIPESVTSIGDYAFCDCSSLTSITIPESVTSIWGFAFYYCSSLTSVTIPEGVTSIKSYAFSFCSSLTSVTIPESVTSIGNGAFRGCRSLTEIDVDESNPAYCDQDGVLFNKSKTELLCCPGARQGAYSIPSGVTSIGNEAFEYCSSLTSVTIPESVTSIEILAFADCSSLTGVTIPESVTSIKSYAFSFCSSLTSVTIPESVTSIGNGAFRGCRSLTEIDVDESNPAYCDLDGVLFNKSQTELLCFPGARQGAYSIPSGITSIGDEAFEYCSSLTSVTIPESVTSIGNGAFAYCSSLTGVTIPEGVTSIWGFAFYNCSSLTSVTIPESVTSIGFYAFRGCSSLTDIYYSGSAEQWARIKIGTDNDPLHNATIHYNWVEIEDEGDSTGLLWEEIDGTIMITGYTEALAGRETIHFPSRIEEKLVTRIASEAFKGYSGFKRVIFPVTIKEIGDRAFSGCSKLLNAEFRGSAPELGEDVFDGCSKDFAMWYTKSTEGWPLENYVYIDSTAKIREDQYCGYPCYYNPGHIEICHSYSGETYQNKETWVDATYSDSYFTGSNASLNYALADLSLCMAMATSASPSNTYYEHTTYKSDRYIRTAFETAGFTNDYYSYRYGDSRSTYDEEAYAIAWKELPDGTPLVAVGVRSNGYGGGWVSNANVVNGESPNNAHGFYHAAQVLVNGGGRGVAGVAGEKTNLGLKQYLSVNGIDASQAKIWVFGFSRGGAVSNCVGALLNQDSAFNNNNIYVYSFATPRTVLKSAAGSCQGVYSIVQEMDIVPQVPLQGWGYTRYGTTYTLPCKSVSGRSYSGRLGAMENQFRSLMNSFRSGQQYLSYQGQELIVDELMSLLYTGVPSRSVYGSKLQESIKTVCYRTFVESGNMELDIERILLYLFEDPDLVNELMYATTEHKNFGVMDWINWIGRVKDRANEMPNKDVPGKLILDQLIEILERFLLKVVLSKGSEVLPGGMLTYDYKTSVEYKAIHYALDFVHSNGHPFETPALIQHWPEEYLSWLRSGTMSNTLSDRGYKRAYLECPIDVTVYAGDGTVVAQVIDEQITVEELTVFLDGAGGKEIIIPEDDVYRIEITSRENDAVMSYALTSCDFEGYMESREVFLDIPLTEGQVLTTEVNGEETVIETGDETLSPDMTLGEDSYLSAEVTLESRGNGTVTGGGSYTPGDQALVMALPAEGEALLGWFEGETLISRETIYGFTVTGSRSLTAVFAPAPERIGLDREYLAMKPGESVTLKVTGAAEEWLPYVIWSWESAEENIDTLILTVDDGKVTAMTGGTAYVIATLSVGGTEYTARCRVDVVDQPEGEEHPIAEDVAAEANGVSGVRLINTKATAELFRTEYTRIQVIPELTRNNVTAQSVVLPTPSPEEDGGAAVESARFTEAAVAELFSLRVADDRTLELIPTGAALGAPGAVKKSYSSPIAVTVDGTEFVTEPLKLTVKKTEPKLTAKAVTLNSYFPDSQSVAFSGGTVTSAEPDPAKALPDWLTWDGETRSFSYVGPQSGKKSAKVTLLAEAEGWCVQRPVTVTVNAKSTAPKLSFKPATLTLKPGTADCAAAVWTLSPAAFAGEPVTLARILEGKTERANGEVLNVTLEDGRAIVSAPALDGKAHTYKVWLAVAGKEYAFTVKTLSDKQAVGLTLKAKGTIDLAVEKSPVQITAKTKNYHTEQASFTVCSICKAKTTADVKELFAIKVQENVITLTAAGEPEPGTYTATVEADCGTGEPVSKTVKFTVKRSAKVPAVSLSIKAAGSIDVLRPQTAVTLKPTMKNCYTYTLEPTDVVITRTYDGGAKKKVSEDWTDRFSVTVKDGCYVIQAKPGISHQDKFSAQASAAGVSSKAVTLPVKQGSVKLTQSTKSVTLIRTDRYSRGEVVLTLPDETLTGIARVELDSKSAALFALHDLGNGRYAIGYAGNVITTNKAQTVKLNVFLKGNESAKANVVVSIKISFA